MFSEMIRWERSSLEGKGWGDDERDLGVSRVTAAKYLGALESAGFVRKTKIGRSNFYINEALFDLLRRV